MQKDLRVTILGCGSSGGVPRIGGEWGACDPNETRNRRLRSSVLIEQRTEAGSTLVVIDTGPDFRAQMLQAGVMHLDAVLYTHIHADHVHGIDDVRVLVQRRNKRLPVYMDAATSVFLHKAFGYCFETPEGFHYPPILEEHRVVPGELFSVSGAGGPLSFRPILVEHGEIQALGYRVGACVYMPDVKNIPPESFPFLTDLDVWIVDALRLQPHRSHFSLEETLSWIVKIRPKRAFLTNLHIDMDYATLCASLPAAVRPAYDGLVINLLEAGSPAE